jgi:hypothetical protein
MFNAFWPKINDLESASSAARQGFWAALLICCADIVLGGLALVDVKPIAEINAWIIADGLLFGAIAIGLWLRSRAAAVIGLIFFVAESTIQALTLQGPWLAIMQLLLLLAFVSSVRGTFSYRAYLRQPPGEAVGNKPEGNLALVIFFVLRRIGSVRRRVLGKDAPHWAVDVLAKLLDELPSWVNVLRLIPTLWAILFFPAHFFRRVPQYLGVHPSGYQSPYCTPFGLGFAIVGLTFGADQFLYKHLGFGDLKCIAFAIFCILLPLPLAMFSVLFWCILAPFRFVLRNAGLYINSAHCLIVVDPAGYRRIHPSDRLWGFVYYYGYAISVPQIAFLFGAAVVFLSFARTDVPDVAQSGYAQYLLLALALLLDWVFVAPYCELVRAAVRYPTKRMHQSDIQRLTGSIGHCEYLLDRYAKAKTARFMRERRQADLHKRLSRVLDEGVRNAWTVLERRLRQDRQIEPQLSAAEAAQFHAERSSVYSAKAFTSFAAAWNASELRGSERFAFVDEMLQAVREIAQNRLVEGSLSD